MQLYEDLAQSNGRVYGARESYSGCRGRVQEERGETTCPSGTHRYSDRAGGFASVTSSRQYCYFEQRPKAVNLMNERVKDISCRRMNGETRPKREET